MPRLKIGLTLIISIGLLIFFSHNLGVVVGLLVALIFHEISHILTSYLLGYQVSQLKFTLFGGCLTIDPLFEANPGAETLIAAAGPAINFLMVMGVGYLRFLGFCNEYFEYWQQLNLLIGLVNLLPAYPLDGGRIIHAWLVKSVGLKNAARVSRLLALGLALFFLISGWIQVLLKTGGLAWLIIGFFILGNGWFGKNPEMNPIWRIRHHKLKLLQQKGFLNSKLVLVEPQTPLRVPLQYYGTNDYLLFVFGKDRKNLQLASEDQAWESLCREGYQATFKEILTDEILKDQILKDENFENS